jgi:hypothetical protein
MPDLIVAGVGPMGAALARYLSLGTRYSTATSERPRHEPTRTEGSAYA